MVLWNHQISIPNRVLNNYSTVVKEVQHGSIIEINSILVFVSWRPFALFYLFGRFFFKNYCARLIEWFVIRVTKHFHSFLPEKISELSYLARLLLRCLRCHSFGANQLLKFKLCLFLWLILHLRDIEQRLEGLSQEDTLLQTVELGSEDQSVLHWFNLIPTWVSYCDVIFWRKLKEAGNDLRFHLFLKVLVRCASEDHYQILSNKHFANFWAALNGIDHLLYFVWLDFYNSFLHFCSLFAQRISNLGPFDDRSRVDRGGQVLLLLVSRTQIISQKCCLVLHEIVGILILFPAYFWILAFWHFCLFPSNWLFDIHGNLVKSCEVVICDSLKGRGRSNCLLLSMIDVKAFAHLLRHLFILGCDLPIPDEHSLLDVKWSCLQTQDFHTFAFKKVD